MAILVMQNYHWVALQNVGYVFCFTVLAIHFDKWWVVLFSLLLLSSVTKTYGQQ